MTRTETEKRLLRMLAHVTNALAGASEWVGATNDLEGSDPVYDGDVFESNQLARDLDVVFVDGHAYEKDATPAKDAPI